MGNVTAVRTPVYYRQGDFSPGQPSFVRAPFDFVKQDGVDYIETVGYGGMNMDDEIVGVNDATLLVDKMRQARTGGGYITMPAVIEECRFGSLEDTRVGLFQLGFT